MSDPRSEPLPSTPESAPSVEPPTEDPDVVNDPDGTPAENPSG